jgi:putative DNA primase/helicase
MPRTSHKPGSTTRNGWNDNLTQYVSPNASLSLAEEEETLFQTNVDHRFKTAGKLAQWTENVGNLCAGNSRLILATSAAFAAPLLGLIEGTETGGIHLVGPSSPGKSTALVVAGSVGACRTPDSSQLADHGKWS